LLTPTAWLAVVAVLGWATRGVLEQIEHGATFDAVIGSAAAGGAWLALFWLTAGFTVAVIAALPGATGSAWDRMAARMTPAGVRRSARFLAGAALVTGGIGGAAMPAFAGGGPPTPAATGHGVAADLDRPGSGDPAATLGTPPSEAADAPSPMTTGTPSSSTAAAPTAPSGEAVTVAPGDTLWGIAAERLGPDATNAEIAIEWPRWYAANRQVVGADPNLIYPGQRLRPPRH
jgi:nucleoid-associated protein YgaU